jgi:hypothetical protein
MIGTYNSGDKKQKPIKIGSNHVDKPSFKESVQNFFAKELKPYHSKTKNPASVRVGNGWKKKELPQHEQQRRAMEGIYLGRQDNFGKGVGP